MAAPALSANKINGSDHDDASLKIIIVGGGIGGLTAAISLRRQGHEVDVGPMGYPTCLHVLS